MRDIIYSLRTGSSMLGNSEYFEELLKMNRECGDVFDEVWFPTSYACPSIEKCKKITEDIKDGMEIFKKYGVVPSIQVSRTNHGKAFAGKIYIRRIRKNDRP